MFFPMSIYCPSMIGRLKRKLQKPLCYISIISFIVGIHYCVHHEHSHSRTIRSFNESELIEDALLNIPTCTAEDRVRQRALLTTLQIWSRLAQKFNIQYWLNFGTLVGYVQRRGLLPHDLDVDLIIMAQDTAQLVALSERLSNENLTWFDSNLYKLVVHPQWFIVEWESRSYNRSEGIDFIAPNARFINQQTYDYLDIWSMNDYHPGQPENVTNKIPMLTQIDNDYSWRSSPRNWTFPLHPCDFSGVRVWCPTAPEKIVSAMYGKSALHKSDTSCVNGSWVSN